MHIYMLKARKFQGCNASCIDRKPEYPSTVTKKYHL